MITALWWFTIFYGVHVMTRQGVSPSTRNEWDEKNEIQLNG